MKKIALFLFVFFISQPTFAADLTLLSLTEVLGGIFWVWLPIFGINEVQTTNTIIGGFIITFALMYYSLNTKRNRRFIGLN